MKAFGIVFAAALLQTATTQRTPTISYITQEQIKDIGGTVQLDCSVQYAQDFPILWMKTDDKSVRQMPISNKATLILKDTRYSLDYRTDASTYSLQIRDIQENDAGTYQCQIVMSLSNTVVASVKLSVRRAPFITDNSTRSLIMTEGEEAELKCYANGNPPPRITWRRENYEMLSTGGSIYRGNVLKIPFVRKESRGTYYCVAENGVGRGATRNINLEVNFAPVVTATRPRFGQALQYDMDLECHVEAFPPPAITWHHDGFQLSNNQHHVISNYANTDQGTDTSIHVITIEKRQYGEYICRAKNNFGESEATVELYETANPMCPPACGQTHDVANALPATSGSLIAFFLLVSSILR